MSVIAPRLLIRLGSMGDVVLATAAATAWREQDPESPIDVLVKEAWGAVWEGHPAVRRVLAWSPADLEPSALRRGAAAIRAEGYREALDLQSSPRTRALLALAGVARVRRPRRQALRRRLLVRFKRGGPAPGFSVLRTYLDAVAPGAHALPSLHPGPVARARAAALVPAGAVALIPGARHATKRWPIDRFAEVGRRFVAEGRGRVVVFAAPDEEDLLAALRAAWNPDGAWIAVREPIPVAAAALARCAVAITGDTGLMHVAAAAGTPVVALFGPTATAFGFAPAGPGHRVLERSLPCRPCSLHGTSTCPERHFRCMLDLEPGEVHAAAVSLLERPTRATARHA